jgi:DNA-binding NarL/FixJ family response regulator
VTAHNISVSIIEDNDEIRQTIALIIDGTPGFTCKHTFENAEDAVDEIRDLVVDVVLMDIDLPGISGILGMKKIKEKCPEIDFIMLTIHKDSETVFRSLCAGASGYLVKETPPTELLRSIREVYDGGAPMSASIARKVIGSFHRKVKNPLSERETELLQLLCDGLNYKAIAEDKFLSPQTVKTHIKNIYRKLEVNSRAEAVSKAHRQGLTI